MTSVLVFEFDGKIDETTIDDMDINKLNDLICHQGDGDMELVLKFSYFSDKISLYGWKKGNDLYMNHNNSIFQKLYKGPLVLYGGFILLKQNNDNIYVDLNYDEYINDITHYIQQQHTTDTDGSDTEEYENNLKILETNKKKDQFDLQDYLVDNYLN